MRPPDFYAENGRVQLWQGDCLDLLPELPERSIDALITDPPYSSGGQFRSDRMRSTAEKYVRSSTRAIVDVSDFTGDNRDQRSFLTWCTLWLTAARHAAKPGAVACVFSDWRQVPTITDAVQCAGWTWRNLATWWKPGIRMQKGRFSASAEFVVYGTNGPHESDGAASPQNVFSWPSLGNDEKDHIAEKPADVVAWAMSVARPGSVVLDPFLGSGSAAVAAIRSQRKFLGFELDPAYFELAVQRITAELNRHPLFW